jgi:hypothetical protein
MQGDLSRRARIFRVLHAAIAAAFLVAIVYVWWCALSGRRGRLLHVAVTSLIAEGILVLVNRGDCPLGGLQERMGDPVPLFELVLSPPAARRAVPVLGVVTAAGLFVLAQRDRPGKWTVGSKHRYPATRACRSED